MQWVVAWPVAKLLEFILGPHHGIIYRRTELKELIAMHSDAGTQGGDLHKDTVTIIGATLDLQEKVVRQAMTPIDKVFMLSIDAKLDYETLRRICLTGHSRIPVYEEVQVSRALVPDAPALPASKAKRSADSKSADMVKVKKIVGILLVKQCVLLDPEGMFPSIVPPYLLTVYLDAVPVRKMRLNKVPFVPQNEPLLGMLDRFQEGRSHIAIVSRISVEKAASVKKAAKKGLTRRLKESVMGDTSSSTSDSSSDSESDDESSRPLKWIHRKMKSNSSVHENEEDSNVGTTLVHTSSGDSAKPKNESKARQRKDRKRWHKHRKSRTAVAGNEDLEMGDLEAENHRSNKMLAGANLLAKGNALEQSMPADAVLTKAGAEEVSRLHIP